jgi:hypothetical protein
MLKPGGFSLPKNTTRARPKQYQYLEKRIDQAKALMPKVRVPDYFLGKANATLLPFPGDEDKHGKYERRSHSIRGHGSQRSEGRYPRYVIDLSKDEMRMLIEILHIDTTGTMKHDEYIKKAIADLPKRVRRDRLASSNKEICRLHHGVNSDVIRDILDLIKREVEHHPHWFEEFPHLTKPLDQLILTKLRAIKGMWIKRPSKPVDPDLWSYQENCCPACMVARVTGDKNALRNLRVSLLSRTPVRKRHQPRRLMKFVDMGIDQFPEYIDELYGTSSQFAFILKETRKKCIKAWQKDPCNVISVRSHRHGHKHGHLKRSNSKYDPKKDYVQPPPEITSCHPSQKSSTGGPPSWIRRAESIIESPSMHQGSSSRQKSSGSSPRRQASVIHRTNSQLQDCIKGSKAGPSTSQSHGHSTKEPRRKRAPSPPPSTAIGPPDEVDKLIDMYRSMAMNPFKGRTERLVTDHNDHQTCESIEVPVAHRYTASEYTPSVYSVETEWEDDEIVDCDAHEKHMSKCESDAMTIWSTLCGEASK